MLIRWIHRGAHPAEILAQFKLSAHETRHVELPWGKAVLFCSNNSPDEVEVDLMLQVEPHRLLHDPGVLSDGPVLRQFVNARPYQAGAILAFALERLAEQVDLQAEAISLETIIDGLVTDHGRELWFQFAASLGMETAWQAYASSETQGAMTLRCTSSLEDLFQRIQLLSMAFDPDALDTIGEANYRMLLNKLAAVFASHAHGRDMVSLATKLPDWRARQAFGDLLDLDEAGSIPEVSPHGEKQAAYWKDQTLATLTGIQATSAAILLPRDGVLANSLAAMPEVNRIEVTHIRLDVLHQVIAQIRDSGLDTSLTSKVLLHLHSPIVQASFLDGLDAIVVSDTAGLVAPWHLPAIAQLVLDHHRPKVALWYIAQPASPERWAADLAAKTACSYELKANPHGGWLVIFQPNLNA